MARVLLEKFTAIMKWDVNGLAVMHVGGLATGLATLVGI